MENLNVEYVNIDALVPHPKNCHNHSDDQIDRLCDIIKYQSFRNPVTVQKGTNLIVCGHGRTMAAKKLGMDKVPVIYQEFESEAQLYAHLVADNAIGKDSWASLDLSKINMDILDLGPDLDIEMLGLKDFEVEPLDRLDPQTDEDAVPEVKEEAVTKKGDIWSLGKHRVMCGDSTMIDDIDKLMNGRMADMVFTSPPYNANSKTGDGDIFGGKKAKDMYKGEFVDNQGSDEYIQFAKDILEVCFQFTDGFIFWNVSYNAKSKFEYIAQIEDRLEYLIEQVCWKKSSTIPFKGMLMRDWEPIYIFSTNKKNLQTKNVVSNFWQINNTDSQQENHKACFPVALPEKGLDLVEIKTGVVFEPFCGSGTTVIACEKNNRSCYGMELDPHYCDVIIDRWEKYTGKKAELLNGNI